MFSSLFVSYCSARSWLTTWPRVIHFHWGEHLPERKTIVVNYVCTCRSHHNKRTTMNCTHCVPECGTCNWQFVDFNALTTQLNLRVWFQLKWTINVLGTICNDAICNSLRVIWNCIQTPNTVRVKTIKSDEGILVHNISFLELHWNLADLILWVSVLKDLKYRNTRL